MCLSYTKRLWAVMFLIITLGNTLKLQALGEETIGNTGIWSAVGRIAGFLLNKCLPMNFKEYNQLQQNDNSGLILQECLKRRGLRAIDRALSRDIIEISEGVVLVKWKNDTEVDDSDTSFRQHEGFTTKSLKEASNWTRAFLPKVVSFFKTRLLRIHLKGINFNGTVEGRGRKKNNMFGQLMMFGLVAAGLIVIPLGFQFLAVLGGKALLLAKLALILTSIQGLKKIATSNVNYGLYSTGHGGTCPVFFLPDKLAKQINEKAVTKNTIVTNETGQYDRQWPYDLESYPTFTAADSSSDHLHHPSAHSSQYSFHPRVENVRGTY